MFEFRMSKTQFQASVIWLTIFSILCVVNSIILGIVAGFEGPSWYLELSMLVPFAHCAIWWIPIIMYNAFYCLVRFRKDPDNAYLKQAHPEIWKKLHPWGDFSHNGFAGLGFMLGKYGAGDDEKLNDIRQKRLRFTKIILWVFFLIPTVWVLNLISIGIASLTR